MSIDFDLTDGIATITINRPERMNAMDAEHYKGLSQAWTRVRDESAIRVAIITGAGEKAFSAGADIKSFLTSPLGLDEMWLTQRDQLLNRGLEVWKPVIRSEERRVGKECRSRRTRASQTKKKATSAR